MGNLKHLLSSTTNKAPTTTTTGVAKTYIGDDPRKTQPNRAPTASAGTNVGSSTQMKKKKTTGSTGSGVNIV